MPHLTNKNSFKNQGLAIFVASVASFGKRFGKKKSFKIKEMPFMTQIVGLKWRGAWAWQAEKEKAGKKGM